MVYGVSGTAADCESLDGFGSCALTMDKRVVGSGLYIMESDFTDVSKASHNDLATTTKEVKSSQETKTLERRSSDVI